MRPKDLWSELTIIAIYVLGFFLLFNLSWELGWGIVFVLWAHNLEKSGWRWRT